jgi:hypothetical protein
MAMDLSIRSWWRYLLGYLVSISLEDQSWTNLQINVIENWRGIKKEQSREKGNIGHKTQNDDKTKQKS